MKKSQKTESRRISLSIVGRVFVWIVSIVLLLASIGAFAVSRFLYGGIILALGLIVLPFSGRFVKKHVHIELSGRVKVAIVIGGLILLSILDIGQPPVRTDAFGSSFQTAIIVEADNEKEGVAWEYSYLRANACKGKGLREVLGQSLERRDGHMFDRLVVSCRDGVNEAYYFRIDSFFGKV